MARSLAGDGRLGCHLVGLVISGRAGTPPKSRSCPLRQAAREVFSSRRLQLDPSRKNKIRSPLAPLLTSPGWPAPRLPLPRASVSVRGCGPAPACEPRCPGRPLPLLELCAAEALTLEYRANSDTPHPHLPVPATSHTPGRRRTRDTPRPAPATETDRLRRSTSFVSPPALKRRPSQSSVTPPSRSSRALDPLFPNPPPLPLLSSASTLLLVLLLLLSSLSAAAHNVGSSASPHLQRCLRGGGCGRAQVGAPHPRQLEHHAAQEDSW